jgi:putative N6-adenine-specific DNA methylase
VLLDTGCWLVFIILSTQLLAPISRHLDPSNQHPMKLIAKTLYGLEKTLADELIDLGAKVVQQVNRAVIFEGNKDFLYKVNYCVRSAMSVLMQFSEFQIRSADDLYRNSLKLNWSNYLDPEHTFSIVPVVNSPMFSHTGYPGLILKDAIADWFRQKAGKRPSVNTKDPDIVFNLHISNERVAISLDSSVIPLYKRGYRKDQGSAPINEILAAGIVLISGWKGETPFLDPMCGSGTIPIEAAMIASHIPPGRFRKFYGFQRWKDYDENLFVQVKKESEAKALNPGVKIAGSDISDDAVLIASANVESAGLSDIISIGKDDFRDVRTLDSEGIIIMNPPYGERIKTTDDLYSMIGSSLKHNFAGHTAWLITSDKESLKHVALKPAIKTTLFNGALECILVKYEMYQGSKKNQ